MRVDRDEILVDIGSKSEGIVPAKEFSSLTSSEKQALAIGETVLVFVVQPENQEGHAVVSIDRARQEKMLATTAGNLRGERASSTPRSPITTRAACW